MLARHHRQRGDEVFFLTGTDEHGDQVAQAAHALGSRRRSSSTATRSASGRSPRGSTPATTSSSARPTPSTRPSCRRCCRACATTGTSTSASTRACTARLRGLQLRERDRRWQLSRSTTSALTRERRRTTTSCCPPTRTGSRVLSQAARIRGAALALQRGAVVHQPGCATSLSRRKMHLGHPRAVGPRAGDLRLGRRADQLLLGAHLRPAGRRSESRVLAGRHPPDGQGHPQVPRRHLAGAAVEPGSSCRGRVHPRLPADGRREDEQDARQRARPVRGDRRASASTRCASICFARSASARTASVVEGRFEQRYKNELANELGNLASRAIAMIVRYRGGVVSAGEPTACSPMTSPAWASALASCSTGSS